MPAKKRKQANDDLVVKASILIGVREHALWAACASLRGMDRSAFAVEAIKAACQGLVLVDRRKPATGVKIVDRPDAPGPVSVDGPETAA